MAKTEGFTTGNELKSYISGIDAAIDLQNIKSGLAQAAVDVKDIVSPEVYQLYIAYQDMTQGQIDALTPEYKTLLDELTAFIRVPLAALAMYHHFVWLTIRVTNSGVVTTKSNNETAAYKYQTDEAKSALLQRAYAGFSDAIDFLTQKATPCTDFTANTKYAADACVRHLFKFYKANAGFTSAETFNASDWTEVPASAVFFNEWTFSDQKRESQELIFVNYREFDKYYGIDRSAAFYIKARHIIRRLALQHLTPRFGSLVPAEYIDEAKFFVAFRTMAEAILYLDVNLLPESLRGPINNEMNKKGGDVQFIRENLRNRLITDAGDYLKSIDLRRASAEQAVDDTTNPADKFQVIADTDKKFYSSI